MKRILFCLWIALPCFAVSSQAAEPATPTPLVREDIEWIRVWVPGVNHTDHPRVLLIGDSITEAYSGPVTQQLEKEAYVAHLATSKSLGDPAYLKEVELVLGNTTFAVIHFNNGMHGQGYSEHDYRRDFPKLLELLRTHAPNAKLIWATTTPKRVPQHLDEFDPFNARIKTRNLIGHEFIDPAGIPVDDLFGLVEEHPDFYSQDGTHFNKEGIEAEAKQVAESIRKALGGSR